MIKYELEFIHFLATRLIVQSLITANVWSRAKVMCGIWNMEFAGGVTNIALTGTEVSRVLKCSSPPKSNISKEEFRPLREFRKDKS